MAEYGSIAAIPKKLGPSLNMGQNGKIYMQYFSSKFRFKLVYFNSKIIFQSTDNGTMCKDWIIKE